MSDRATSAPARSQVGPLAPPGEAAPVPSGGRLDGDQRPRLLRRVPALDGLRAVAVLAVLAYHAAYLTQEWFSRPLQGGFLGVDLFFAISGFLITAGLVDELQGTGEISFGRFWVRRMRRLVPALMALLAVVVAVLAATGWRLVGLEGRGLLDWHQTLLAVFGTATYVSNWFQASHSPFPFELSHTWSLAIEMQFYLAWPLALLAAVRLGLRRRTVVALVVAGIVAAALARAVLWTGPGSALELYVRTDTRADVILLGCLGGLFAGWRWIGPATRRLLRTASVAAAVVVVWVFAFAHQDSVRLYRGGFTGVAIAAAVLVVAIATEPEAPLGRALAWRPLVWIGERSYSIYLWHLPVFIAVASHTHWKPWPRLLFALGVTFAASELSYRLVEHPLRARPRAA